MKVYTYHHNCPTCGKGCNCGIIQTNHGPICDHCRKPMRITIKVEKPKKRRL